MRSGGSARLAGVMATTPASCDAPGALSQVSTPEILANLLGADRLRLGLRRSGAGSVANEADQNVLTRLVEQIPTQAVGAVVSAAVQALIAVLGA